MSVELLIIKANETYGEGRICIADDCDTVLSRYNPGPECYCCTSLTKKIERLRRENRRRPAA